MKPVLKAPGAKLLKLRYDELLSNFSFNFNVRRYTKVAVLGASPDASVRKYVARIQGKIAAQP
jgi:hypothetical protein